MVDEDSVPALDRLCDDKCSRPFTTYAGGSSSRRNGRKPLRPYCPSAQLAGSVRSLFGSESRRFRDLPFCVQGDPAPRHAPPSSAFGDKLLQSGTLRACDLFSVEKEHCIQEVGGRRSVHARELLNPALAGSG
jgi:hypothetical protein